MEYKELGKSILELISIEAEEEFPISPEEILIMAERIDEDD